MNLRNFNIAIFLLLLTSLLVSGAAGEPAILGKITYFSGNTRVTDRDEMKRDDLKQLYLHDGMRVETDTQSRCEMSFRAKSIVRIDEHTRIEIKENTTGNDKVSIEDGDIWLAHLLPETESAVEIETPSSACSIRGTVYRLSCDNNHTAYRCYKGTIKVKPITAKNQISPDDSFLIGKGEELILVNNFTEYLNKQKKEFNEFVDKKMEDFERYHRQQMTSFNESVKRDLEDFKKMNGYYIRRKPFDEKKDMASDWVRWNMERDKKLTSGLPRRVSSPRSNP